MDINQNNKATDFQEQNPNLQEIENLIEIQNNGMCLFEYVSSTNSKETSKTILFDPKQQQENIKVNQNSEQVTANNDNKVFSITDQQQIHDQQPQKIIESDSQKRLIYENKATNKIQQANQQKGHELSSDKKIDEISETLNMNQKHLKIKQKQILNQQPRSFLDIPNETSRLDNCDQSQAQTINYHHDDFPLSNQTITKTETTFRNNLNSSMPQNQPIFMDQLTIQSNDRAQTYSRPEISTITTQYNNVAQNSLNTQMHMRQIAQQQITNRPQTHNNHIRQTFKTLDVFHDSLNHDDNSYRNYSNQSKSDAITVNGQRVQHQIYQHQDDIIAKLDSDTVSNAKQESNSEKRSQKNSKLRYQNHQDETDAQEQDQILLDDLQVQEQSIEETVYTDGGYLNQNRYGQSTMASQINHRNIMTSEMTTKQRIKKLIEKRKSSILSQYELNRTTQANTSEQRSYSVRGQSFKQMMLKTLMNRKQSIQKPNKSNGIYEKGLQQYQGSPYMEERVQVDQNPSIQMGGQKQVNIQEEAVNQILNQSDINNISYVSNQNAKKQGILDVEKFYELISHRQTQETQRIDRQEKDENVQSKSSEKEANQQNQPQANLTKKQKWQLVKSYIEKNPEILLEESAQDHNFEQQSITNLQQQQNVLNLNDSLFDDQSQLSGYDQSFRSQSLLKSKLQRNLDLSKQIISESIIEENNATMDDTITSSHLISNTGNTGYSRSVRSGDRPFSINKRRERSGLLKKPRNSQLGNISEFQNKTQDLKQFNVRPQSKSSIRYLDSQNFISVAPQSTMNINQTHDFNQENLQMRQSFSQNNSLPRFLNQNNANNNQVQNHSLNIHQKDGTSSQISGGFISLKQRLVKHKIDSISQVNRAEDQNYSGFHQPKRSQDMDNLTTQRSKSTVQQKKKYDKQLQNHIDWSKSMLKKFIDFPEQQEQQFVVDATVYSNEDIDYMINMIRLNEKAFEKSNTLSQILNKTINTITRQCNDLDLDKVAIKIYYHYADRDSKTLLKLLLRCKEFFVIRVRIVKILKLIHDREILMSALKSMIMEFSQLDEKELSLRNSDKSIQLRQLNYNINALSEELNYLEVARREAKEIGEVLLLIRGE
eukprot:403344858